ncbi:PhzF family phenazine biosynthesis protein [Lacibacter sp. MH-610]|uniref:PhzF family phenazine biosynthesis protein n=1 Tax=Lacibacter sp. MH-610 TaxID=3020883 RepID=UPI00389277DD
MTNLPIYQVDAFASALFKGNPAAVIPLSAWIDDGLMQQIAAENNLAETVFFVPQENSEADFHIRWFTPEFEINLCGHATLASAFVIFNYLGFSKDTVVFSSQSGLLRVTRKDSILEMDFPSWKPKPATDAPAHIAEILGIGAIKGVYRHRDLMIEVATEEEVLAARPDFTALKKTKEMVILTAPGKEADFVSRFFAPDAAVDEDPVTGSAHSQLIPFWSEKLNRKKMFAKQLSKRGGELWCEDVGNRVIIGGQCVFYMKGEITV